MIDASARTEETNMKRTVIAGVLLLAAAVGGGVGIATASPAPTGPVLSATPNTAQFKPSTVDFNNDGSNTMTSVIWDSWGGPTAVGHGLYEEEVCKTGLGAECNIWKHFWNEKITLSHLVDGKYLKLAVHDFDEEAD